MDSGIVMWPQTQAPKSTHPFNEEDNYVFTNPSAWAGCDTRSIF